MKKLILSAFVASLALLPAASLATSPSVTVAGCPGTYTKVINLSSGVRYSKSLNNTAVVTPGNSSITVNGNGNCVLGGSGSMVKVNGNNNFVSGRHSSLRLTGTGNEVTSGGSSFVDGGGGICNVDSSDIARNCSNL